MCSSCVFLVYIAILSSFETAFPQLDGCETHFWKITLPVGEHMSGSVCLNPDETWRRVSPLSLLNSLWCRLVIIQHGVIAEDAA